MQGARSTLLRDKRVGAISQYIHYSPSLNVLLVRMGGGRSAAGMAQETPHAQARRVVGGLCVRRLSSHGAKHCHAHPLRVLSPSAIFAMVSQSYRLKSPAVD